MVHKRMTYDCRAIANIVLDIADEQHLRLTHMAVHKICYYANGWHLAKHNQPLILQEFEAWRDGPVQRLVWDCFKTAGKHPITGRATEFNLVTRQTTTCRATLEAGQRDLLTHIVAGYGPLHAFELSEMTHEPGGPWDQVYNAPQGQVNLGMRIPHHLIRAHFLQQAMRRRSQS